MIGRLVRFAATLVAAVAAAACSSSSSNSAVESDAAAGDGPTADSRARDSAIGPIKELNGDGATAASSPVQCGSMTCNPPAAAGLPIPLSACCLPDNSC